MHAGDSDVERYVRETIDELQRWSCIDQDAGKRSRKLAEQLFQDGYPLERVRHAILLGVKGKFIQLSKNPEAEKIGHLSYFRPLIPEAAAVAAQGKDEYWKYLERALIRKGGLRAINNQPCAPAASIRSAGTPE